MSLSLSRQAAGSSSASSSSSAQATPASSSSSSSSQAVVATSKGSLLFAGFNQDNSCFAVGTGSGFVIYHVDPLKETFRRIFSNGGIGIVEMIYRCNLLAIVGGGSNPRYPPTKVMIWDDCQNKCIGELMFKSEVYAVKLRRDRIVVVLQTKVYVYRFKDLKLMDQIQTIFNPKGLVSLCSDAANNVLAVPGVTEGTIRIELYNISKATILKAHDTSLAQFTLTFDGSKIASASEKGTLIRIWDCISGELLRELRRGMDRADIYCLAFNFNSTRLACTSDKGTVHIFNIFGGGSSSSSSSSGAGVSSSSSTGSGKEGGGEEGGGRARGYSQDNTPSGVDKHSSNKSLNLGIFRSLIPASFKYVDSEWSYAQIHGVEGRSIVAFGRDSSGADGGNKIFVVSSEGAFLACSLPESGECPRLAQSNFLSSLAPSSSSSSSSAGASNDAGILLDEDDSTDTLGLVGGGSTNYNNNNSNSNNSSSGGGGSSS